MSKIQLIFQNYQEKITLGFCLLLSFILIFNNDSDSIKNAKINSLNTFSFLYQPFNWLDNQLFLNKKLEVLSSENLRLNLENQVLKVHQTENIRYREFLNFKKRENISSESSLYWRRHEDTYIYIRDNPSVYKNDHISHKLGFQNNISIFSDIGITGIGIDLSNTWLSSNNLGERKRFITTIFAEQLINKNKFSFTPGIAFSIYEKPTNDLFKSKLFPGIDIGYKLSNKISLNANIGETFIIPTFTDLYYSDPNNQWNENLDPEKAFTSEVGFKLKEKNYGISLSLFRRKSDDLIDNEKVTKVFLGN